MRGKDHFCVCPSDNNRITPAYAGKSAENLQYVVDPEDHPRLCGEKDECGR